MSILRSNPYYIGRDLRRHRPELARDMASLPDDLTVYVLLDGSDENHQRLFRCLISRGDDRLADVRKCRTWEAAWEAARAAYELAVAA